jgi:hypothetical protein
MRLQYLVLQKSQTWRDVGKGDLKISWTGSESIRRLCGDGRTFWGGGHGSSEDCWMLIFDSAEAWSDQGYT